MVAAFALLAMIPPSFAAASSPPLATPVLTCGVLAGPGAYLGPAPEGEWTEDAIEVRDGTQLLWYPRDGRPRRATLRVVQDPGRWAYVALDIGTDTYLLARDGDRAVLRKRPAGFASGKEPGYAQWLDRWRAQDPYASGLPLAIVPALQVQTPGDCPGAGEQHL